MAVLRMFYTEKELVISPTRSFKPISKIAEDVTVVTADDIRRMNAHTVADVLNRVQGVFVNYTQDFGATSIIGIQGATQIDTLVMFDGVPWNYISNGAAETNTIPVGTIDRIEIIRGPASSAWGSSLGGVINIITKKASSSRPVSGMASASYGQHSTSDLRAEIRGKLGHVGYYLYSGEQHSNGLRSSRNFEGNNLYSKFNMDISKDMTVGVSMGFSDPDMDFGTFSYPGMTLHIKGKSRTSFLTAHLDSKLSDSLSFNTSFHYFKNRFRSLYKSQGLLLQAQVFDEETIGGVAKLSYRDRFHNVTVGMDVDRCNLYYKQYQQGFHANRKPHREKWAVYLNDTVTLGRCSITPGMRYDHDSRVGSFVSPSLGITCTMFDDTILRASFTRGFTTPPLLYMLDNSSLDYEKIISYEMGFETAMLRYAWVKTTFFYHVIDDMIKRDAKGYHNKGNNRTQSGVVFETETQPIYNLRLKCGFSYMHSSNEDPTTGSADMRKYTLGIIYEDKGSFTADLFGHYVWWDMTRSLNASYDDIIWDLNLRKRIWSSFYSSGSIFFTGHNLFDCSQYSNSHYKNPGRWVEAGIEIGF